MADGSLAGKVAHDHGSLATTMVTARTCRRPARSRMVARAERYATTFLIYFLLLAGAVIILTPLAWMISTSLKPKDMVFAYPPQWLPSPPRWQNYPEALSTEPFGRFFLNTTFITVLNVIGSLLSCSLVGFSFARLRWRGRDLMFIIMLSTMMLPYTVTLIPQYVIFRLFHWVDTFYPLWVPGFFGTPFLIFLVRQFFRTISPELDDAARIDGCGVLGLYWRILLPLSKPVMAACAIFTFNWTWNDFLGPLIYINSKEKFTLSIGITVFRSAAHGTDWHYLMAASLVMVTPVVVLFFFAQKYFIQGIVFTGVKG